MPILIVLVGLNRQHRLILVLLTVTSNFVLVYMYDLFHSEGDVFLSWREARGESTFSSSNLILGIKLLLEQTSLEVKGLRVQRGVNLNDSFLSLSEEGLIVRQGIRSPKGNCFTCWY